MDDELIPEKKWWKSRFFILPLLAVVLAAVTIFMFASERSRKKDERDHGIVFDQAKWKAKEGDQYPYRNKMLKDMISAENLPVWKKMSKQEIFETLGQPDRINGDYLYYKVNGDKIGFMTFHTIALVIRLNDSTGNIVRIYE